MEDEKDEEEPFMTISEPLRVRHTHQELLKESFVDGIAAPHWAETERPHRIMKDILSPRQGDASRLAGDVEAERIEGGDSLSTLVGGGGGGGLAGEPRCSEPVAAPPKAPPQPCRHAAPHSGAAAGHARVGSPRLVGRHRAGAPHR